MAYNLQSLITILQQILNPEQKHWILDDHKNPQLESLLEKAVSLKQILENSSNSRVESLESKIREAAHKAEDIIEAHMVDQMLSRPGGVSFTFSTPDDQDLQQVMQELDSANEQVAKFMEESKISTASSSTGASFSIDPSSHSVHVVGFEEDLLQLLGRLTGMQRKLEIIPIVGMGGIGKTTLARKLYNDPLVVSKFEYRAWITISDYNVRVILLGLLGCIIGKLRSELTGKKDHELKDILYQNLYSRRYVIVLDDMWSSKSWDDFKLSDVIYPELALGQMKLQSISTVDLVVATRSGFLESIPNIRNLGIRCLTLSFSAVDLRHLHQLGTLKCTSDLSLETRRFLATIRFPSSVRKLCLHECAISQEFLMTLRALPNLGVLKIRKCFFESEAHGAEE